MICKFSENVHLNAFGSNECIRSDPPLGLMSILFRGETNNSGNKNNNFACDYDQTVSEHVTNTY